MNKESASRIFSDSIIDVISRVPEHRLILALDEIEWISFKISPKEHWNSEFLPFWQTMRAIHQNTNGSFTFIISGVNPKCIEEESIGGYDNPLFALIKPHFLKPFDDQSTRTMIRTLGKYMGIKFEYDFYTALIESYGGHPFLVRHACSKISELIPDRPITITKNNFDTYKNQINLSLQRYIKQILNVLAVWYPEEYEMVVLLSKKQIDKVKDHLKQQPEFLEHLVGYGLVVISGGEPKLSLLILSSHLKKDKNKDVIQAANTQNIEEDIEDIRVEISRRRNSIELWLHQLIKNGLRFKHGNRCMDKILSSLSQERRSVLSRYGYDAIFDELYFSELVTILNKNWDSFQNWFNQDLKDVETWLNTINKLRIDAHAKGIKADDLSYLRFCFSRLEEIKDR